ncbi:glycosyltransferase [Paenibacillus aurantiacus]|uniref:Glycosyltransferase n=1 Tax=Paenibacillus aurantiacus TaxID=1936118 RepID=A0ABV5KIK5_9BACL
MKKKLLFVMPSLSAGGGEKSLINLLSQLDYDQYEVDLFLLHQDGLFMAYIPKEVRLLPLPADYREFAKPLAASLLGLLRRGKPGLAWSRLRFAANARKKRSIPENEQQGWKYTARALPPLTARYDAAIGFLENTATYFCVDKVEAVRKIGWMHIDYDQLGMDPAFDLPYFKRLDYLVTVSEECASVLRARFPSEREKVKVMYNIVSPSIIRKMAAMGEADVYGRAQGETIILSVGRLHYQKGFETAVEACRLLVSEGYNLRWCVIGEGEERQALTEQIRAANLEGRFELLGLRPNPYPYIQQADLYVQPSKFEGKSIAIDEAKILAKPIVVTDFSTAKDQIEHDRSGLIVGMDARAVADGIRRLLQEPRLRARLTEHLGQAELGTEEEIAKLNRLLA